MTYQQPNGIPDIIRCKHCIHRGIDTECPMVFVEHYYHEGYEEWDDEGYEGWDDITTDNSRDNGYCDRGEMEDVENTAKLENKAG